MNLLFWPHFSQQCQFLAKKYLALVFSNLHNTAAGLAVLAVCTTDARQWYLQNGLQLNPDKSEALVVGNANQLCVVDSSSSSVSVAGVDLPVAEDMKVLGDVLHWRLTFHKHVLMFTRSYNNYYGPNGALVVVYVPLPPSHQISSIDGVSTDVNM